MVLNYSQLKGRLSEFGADLEHQLFYLDDLRSRCREGVPNEKHTARGDVVEIIEKFPSLELAATQEMIRVLKYIEDKADQEAVGSAERSQGATVTFNIMPLDSDG